MVYLSYQSHCWRYIALTRSFPLHLLLSYFNSRFIYSALFKLGNMKVFIHFLPSTQGRYSYFTCFQVHREISYEMIILVCFLNFRLVINPKTKKRKYKKDRNITVVGISSGKISAIIFVYFFFHFHYLKETSAIEDLNRCI